MTGSITGHAPDQLKIARKQLTPAAYARLLAQWEQHKRYTVVQTADGKIFVSLLPSELAKSIAAAESKHIGQTYFRKRQVLAWLDVNGRECISCSCKYYQRCLIPCRHLLAVKNGVFEVHLDIHPQYLQIYATAFGEDLPRLLQGAGRETAPGTAGFDLNKVPVVTEGEVPEEVCVPGLQALPEEDEEELLPDADDTEMQSEWRGRSMHSEATRIWNELGKHIIGVRTTSTS
jgi:hypothetical protein